MNPDYSALLSAFKQEEYNPPRCWQFWCDGMNINIQHLLDVYSGIFHPHVISMMTHYLAMSREERCDFFRDFVEVPPPVYDMPPWPDNPLLYVNYYGQIGPKIELCRRIWLSDHCLPGNYFTFEITSNLRIYVKTACLMGRLEREFKTEIENNLMCIILQLN
jgi:hypothetical protein